MMEQTIILNDIKSTLIKHFGNDVNDVVLFGSQLHNQGVFNDSDFDVLIVLDKKIDWRLENLIYNLCFDLNLKHNIVLDIHLLSKDEMKGTRGKQPIYVNALKSGIHA
jgi:uncharacterized protein